MVADMTARIKYYAVSDVEHDDRNMKSVIFPDFMKIIDKAWFFGSLETTISSTTLKTNLTGTLEFQYVVFVKILFWNLD